jgi:hypothetical protein
MKQLAPIVVFAYRRKKKLQNLINSLLKNNESKNTLIYFFQDSYKDLDDKNDVARVKKYISGVEGFKKKIIISRKKNIGLSNNLISGINFIFKKHNKAIFLEDDLVVSVNFIKFMNQALDKYCKNKKVWHINAWSFDLKENLDRDMFFSRHMNCWGWATWKNRWDKFQNNPERFIKIFNKEMINEFNFNNQIDNWSQIIRNYRKEISTWAIFWYATIFINNGLCLSFNPSLTKYDGFDLDSTYSDPHSLHNNIYTNLLSKKSFIKFSNYVREDKNYNKNLFKFIKNKRNILFKIKSILYKIFLN